MRSLVFGLLPYAVALSIFGVVVPACVSAQTTDKPAAAPQPSPGQPAKKPRPDRVYVKEIEGVWLASDYLETLRTVRLPHLAERSRSPLVIKIQKEGLSYPIVRTDFKKAVLLRVIDLQPDIEKDNYRLALAERDNEPISQRDVTYLPFRGVKNASGQFEALAFADPVFTKRKYRDFVRVGDALATKVNEIVLAGDYVDEQGRSYKFGANGEAAFPESKFSYEISLAAAGANCDYFEAPDDKAPGGKRPYGYTWKAGKLHLFEATGDKPSRVRCASKPFAVLTPQSADGKGPSA